MSRLVDPDKPWTRLVQPGPVTNLHSRLNTMVMIVAVGILVIAVAAVVFAAVTAN